MVEDEAALEVVNDDGAIHIPEIDMVAASGVEAAMDGVQGGNFPVHSL